jgi:dihydrofolate synthase/folylpolyglutamate synthase
VVSILEDKDAAGMLAALSALGRRLVATESSSPRALPAEELVELGREFFDEAEAVGDPVAAHARAREIAGEEGAVLVTGSLYLIMDLASVRPSCLPWQASANG